MSSSAIAEAAQVEHAANLVDVGGFKAEAARRRARVSCGHRSLDLETHDIAEAPPPQLLLDRQEQVVRLVLLDIEVGVAGHPEEVMGVDLHAGEERVKVGRDDPFEQHVRQWRDLPQARQHRRDLDAGEALLARGRSRTVTASDRERSLM